MKYQAGIGKWIRALMAAILPRREQSNETDAQHKSVANNHASLAQSDLSVRTELYKHKRRVRSWIAATAATAIVGAVGFAWAATAPGVTQTFRPDSVLTGAPLNVSTLEITVYNPGNSSLGALNISDLLDPGLSVAGTPSFVNSPNCPGATIGGSGSNITITGGDLPAGALCVFKVNVTASVAGSLNAVIAANSPLAGTTTVGSSAVIAPIAVSDQQFNNPTMLTSFSPTSINPNGATTGHTTIGNSNAAILTNGAFNITIPSGSSLTGVPTLSAGCTGTVSVSGSVISVTGMDVPASGSCTLNYPLTATALGNYSVSSAVGDFTSTTVGGTVVSNDQPNSASFNVVPPSTNALKKEFLDNAIKSTGSPREWVSGQEPPVRLTISNIEGVNWTNVVVTDNMPAPLEVSTANLGLGGSCNATVVTSSSGSVTFNVPTLAAGASCTIQFNTIVPPTVTTKEVLTNSIASMTHDGGAAISMTPASDTITVNQPGAIPDPFDAPQVKTAVGLIGSGLGNTATVDAIIGGRAEFLITISKSVNAQNQLFPVINGKISDDWSSSAQPFIFDSAVVLGSPMTIDGVNLKANDCGAGSVVTPVGSQKFVVSNITMTASKQSCSIRLSLRVDPTAIVADPINGSPQTNTAVVCTDSTNSPTTLCTGSAVQGNAYPTSQATWEVFGGRPLAVTKINNGAAASSVPLGTAFDYTFEIENKNALDANNVQLKDTLPAGIDFVSPLTVRTNTCTDGSTPPAPVVSGKTLTWSIPTIAGIDTNTSKVHKCTLTIRAVADSTATVGPSYSNTIPVGSVTVSGSPNRNNTIEATSVMSFKDPLPGLSLTKSFSNPVVYKENGDGALGSVVLGGSTYPEGSDLELTLRNSTTTANFTNIAFNDILPAGIAVWTPTTPVTSGTCVGATFTGTTANEVKVNVPALGAAQSCTVKVKVIGTATGNFVNTIPANTVTTTEGATNLAPTSKELAVVAATEGLTFYKDVVADGGSTTIHGGAVDVDSTIEYKFVLKNNNIIPTNVKDYAKLVTDTLPTGVTPVAGSATQGGVISGQSVSWDFSNSTVSLNPGQEFTFSVKGTIDTTATGILANIAKVTTAANVVSANCGTSYAGSDCTTTPRVAQCTMPANPLALTAAEIANANICQPAAVSITPVAHSLTKDVVKTGTTASINGGNVVAGDALTYMVTLRNDGTGRLSVKDFVKTITDALPAGLSFVSADNGGTASGQVVTWDLSASTDILAPKGQTGDTKVFSINVTVNNDAKGVLTNIAKTPTQDSNPVTNLVDVVDHSIAKKVYKTSDTGMTSIDTQTVAAGDLLTYELKITNNGDGNLSLKSGIQKITDTLPAGLTYVASSDSGSAAGQVVTWDFTTLVTDVVLAKGESKSVTVDVKVADSASGILKNNVTTASGKTSNDVSNPVSAPKHVLLKDVRKKGTTDSFIGGDVIGNDELTYVVTLKNAGTGNLSLKDFVKQVTDTAPVGTTVTSIGNGGTNVGGVITWDLASDAQVLSPGATREFTFDVKVDESATLPITNVAKTKDVSSCPINDTTCINNPPVPECTMPANVLSVTDVEKADPKVCKPVVNNLILDTTLFIEKTVDRKQAELGDMVKYTVRVKNAGKARATAVKVSDTLPLGFRYIENTTRKSDGTAMAEPLGAPGPGLTFELGNIAAGAELTFTYRVRIGVGAMEGDGTNRAKACTTANKILCSNEGRAKVVVQGGVFTDKACLAGMAYADVNGNSMKDSDEKGVPGVRLYMEDGTNFTTDATGKYSYCGIEPRTHVLKVDKASLPRGSELEITSNRNMGDANSLFLDVKNGELHRGDVAIKPKNEQFMKELELRIKGIYDDASTNGVTFDSAPK